MSHTSSIAPLCLCCRFKVFADYEDYIKCQEKVSALYKVSLSQRKTRVTVSYSWCYTIMYYKILHCAILYYCAPMHIKMNNLLGHKTAEKQTRVTALWVTKAGW